MKIKIAINTVNTFSDKTLPVIIPSLLDCGIEKENIFIFEGGNLERSLNDYDGITYIKTNHNSLEYTSFIEIVENKLESDYWFFMHDTSIVGPNFKNLLYNIPDTNPEKIALKHFPSMSIGSYSYSYLLSKKDLLLSIKNTNYDTETLLYWKKWGVDNEDFILWRNNNIETEVYNPELISLNEPCNSSCGIQPCKHVIVLEYNNIYGGNTTRRKEYYPQLDLFKFKSNWGQSIDVGVQV